MNPHPTDQDDWRREPDRTPEERPLLPGERVGPSETGPLISDVSGLDSPPPLDIVWHRFGDQLRRRARTRLRQYGLTGQAESMDICNEVMADLARRFGNQGVSLDDVLSYILRAIDNQVLDTFRSLARQCRDFRRNELTPVDDLAVANRETTPSQMALRREVLLRIRSLIGEPEAKAIDMMLENRDWNEIGAALGVKADAARMRVRRTLDRVRRDIGLSGADVG